MASERREDMLAPDAEARIRALPGNDTCADCSNIGPQWASVTYGTLICLECSGQHRSLGVHLSFVRSVSMDSWKPKQIAAMEKSGGNAKLVEFFSSRGIDQSIPIATKYNTKQAAYYRDRLARLLDGNTEQQLDDPGRYEPDSAEAPDAQGTEPLPGETPEEYNERQRRLKEAAKERLRHKFGGQGLGGIGSEPEPDDSGLDLDFGALGEKTKMAAGAAAGAVGDAVSGMGTFLRSNVLENENVRSTVDGVSEKTVGAWSALRKTVADGGVAESATGAWTSLRKSVTDVEVLGSIKRNATVEEGSAVSKGLGWGMGAVGGLWQRASKVATEATKNLSEVLNEGAEQAPTGPRCEQGHPLRTEAQSDLRCHLCKAKGTRYSCARGCEYYICIKCFDKPVVPPKSGGKEEEDEGDEQGAEAPPEPTADDIKRLAEELGMTLGGSEGAAPAGAPPNQAEADAKAALAAGRPPKPETAQKAANDDDDFFAGFEETAQPKVKPQPKAKPKDEDIDDFFKDFD